MLRSTLTAPMELTKTPALCLDLDGTVRQSKSGNQYISDHKDIVLTKGIESKIWSYRDAGWLVIAISNQGGVAFGHKTPTGVELEIDATIRLFNENPFHHILYCYHMEGGTVFPYNVRSLLRKPNVGMLVFAEAEAYQEGYVIDWDNSLFVGDRPEDEQCAKNASIAFVHIDKFTYLNEYKSTLFESKK